MSVDAATLKILQDHLATLPMPLQETQVQKFAELLAMLQKWGQVHNLTAVTETEEIIVKHFLDSLCLVPHLQWQNYLDVGCGAGFPSLPLAIASPTKNFVGLDSNNKKIMFFQKVANRLQLANCRGMHMRIENYAPDVVPEAIVCRAFAALADTVKLCERFLQQGSVLLAMKGKLMASELEDLPNDYKVEHVHALQVPGLAAERHLIVVRHI